MLLPDSRKNATPMIEIEDYPSYDYRLNYERDTINGHREGLDEVRQAVWFILYTERYDHEIYDWNYGVELKELFGQPVYYCVPEIERRIREALMMDERILDVHSFEFDTSKRGVISTSFSVSTIFGNLEQEMTVNI